MLTDAWEHKRTAETGSVDPWWRSPLASGVLSLPARPGVLLLSCRFPRWEISLATIASPWFLGIRDRIVAHARIFNRCSPSFPVPLAVWSASGETAHLRVSSTLAADLCALTAIG